FMTDAVCAPTPGNPSAIDETKYAKNRCGSRSSSSSESQQHLNSLSLTASINSDVLPYPAGAETSTSLLSSASNNWFNNRLRVNNSARLRGGIILVLLMGMENMASPFNNKKAATLFYFISESAF
ncbi:MAG TPA: hypothetical protein PLT08_14900, partial [Anaerolineales bacterium]|nr:hypothetical protein [Anaerolineales bacterium]